MEFTDIMTPLSTSTFAGLSIGPVPRTSLLWLDTVSGKTLRVSDFKIHKHALNPVH